MLTIANALAAEVARGERRTYATMTATATATKPTDVTTATVLPPRDIVSSANAFLMRVAQRKIVHPPNAATGRPAPTARDHDAGRSVFTARPYRASVELKRQLRVVDGKLP